MATESQLSLAGAVVSSLSEEALEGATEVLDNSGNMTSMPNVTEVYRDVRDENLATVEIIVQAIIFGVTIIGNSCVLLALKLRTGKLTRMLFFVLHLSLADLQVALLQTLPQLAWDITFRFQGSNFLCKLVKFLQVYAMYLSTYVLVMTAVDRHQAICKPLSSYSWTMKRAHLMVGIAYLLSVVLSVPQLIIFSMTTWEKPGNVFVTDCWVNFPQLRGPKVYVTWYVFSIYVFPLAVISFCYGHICASIWRNIERKTSSIRVPVQRETSSGITSDFDSQDERHSSVQNQSSDASNPRTHSTKVITKAKLKTVKLTLVVVICYVLCWCPFFVSALYGVYHPKPKISNGNLTILVENITAQFSRLFVIKTTLRCTATVNCMLTSPHDE